VAVNFDQLKKDAVDAQMICNIARGIAKGDGVIKLAHVQRYILSRLRADVMALNTVMEAK
jgi:hypothetical protein